MNEFRILYISDVEGSEKRFSFNFWRRYRGSRGHWTSMTRTPLKGCGRVFSRGTVRCLGIGMERLRGGAQWDRKEPENDGVDHGCTGVQEGRTMALRCWSGRKGRLHLFRVHEKIQHKYLLLEGNFVHLLLPASRLRRHGTTKSAAGPFLAALILQRQLGFETATLNSPESFGILYESSHRKFEDMHDMADIQSF